MTSVRCGQLLARLAESLAFPVGRAGAGTAAALTAALALAGAAVEADAPLRQSFDLVVPVPPTPVTVLGESRLVYELHLTSFAAGPLVLRSVEVLDADAGAVLATFGEEELAARLGRPAATDADPSPGTIAPGTRGIVYLELAVAADEPPRTLTHRVAYETTGEEQRERAVVGGGQVEVRAEGPVVLAPPLVGGPWAAIHHPSWERGHRRVVYAVAGRARIPGRFAVDWVLLDAEGRHAAGDDDRVAHWHGYGADVLAVADAVVVAARDGVPESATLSAHPRHPLENAMGNSVTLDLGNGRYAAYEHLRPGSLRVRVGDRVARGEVLAALGFTGHSTGPHLHFHVADANSPLDAEGLPFVLEGFDLLGSYDDIERLGRAPWAPLDPAIAPRRIAEHPAPNVVVTFPAIEPDASGGAVATDTATETGTAPGRDEPGDGATDDEAVRRLWSTLDAIWNERDAERFSELFTTDASWVFVDRGDSMVGRTAIHARFAEQFPALAPELRHRTTVRTVRAVGPDVRAVDAEVEILRDGPGGSVEPTVLRRFAVTAVMPRTQDGWRIAVLRVWQLPLAGTGGEQDPAAVEAELKGLTQELLDAVAPGRVEVWERILDEELVHVDENGVVRDKTALLAEVRPLPAGLVGTIEVDRFQAEVHGDTAIAAVEVQERLDYHGQPLRTRFRSVDTWRRTPEGWRLVAQHVAAVLADPPAVELTREELCSYAGVYRLTPEITTVVRCTDSGLASERAGRPPATYRPEVRDVFFAPGQPRSRRIFTRDATGRVNGFVDRREGEDVRWTRTADLPAGS